MEITLEGRSGTTTVRFVHSGFLGDDWESEYEALAEGDPMYIHQLAEYVRFFRGRPVAIVEHFQPDITDGQAAMAILRGAMGLGDAAALGDAVRLEPAGLAARRGLAWTTCRRPSIGLRTDDALYRFAFIPMGGGIYMGHHVYRDDVDVAGRHLRLGGVAGTRGRGRLGCVAPRYAGLEADHGAVARRASAELRLQLRRSGGEDLLREILVIDRSRHRHGTNERRQRGDRRCPPPPIVGARWEQSYQHVDVDTDLIGVGGPCAGSCSGRRRPRAS